MFNARVAVTGLFTAPVALAETVGVASIEHDYLECL